MKKGFWTLRYTLINVTYFSAFCTIHACAAVYLLANGFSNTQVEFACCCQYSFCCFQPVVAGIIDKQGFLQTDDSF